MHDSSIAIKKALITERVLVSLVKCLPTNIHDESDQHFFFFKKKKHLRVAQHSKCSIREHSLLDCCVLRIQLASG